MAIIVRRHTRVIVRRKDPPPAGEGWPGVPGVPHYAHERQYHLLQINDQRVVLEWKPGRGYIVKDDVELAKNFAHYDYLGLVSIVYRNVTNEAPTAHQYWNRRRRA